MLAEVLPSKEDGVYTSLQEVYRPKASFPLKAWSFMKHMISVFHFLIHLIEIKGMRLDLIGKD